LWRSFLTEEWEVYRVALLVDAEQQAFFDAHGVLAVYLFGSRAKGDARAHSDYDLAVLFTDFCPAQHNITLRLSMAEELSLRLGQRVDLVFLQSASIVMRFEIVATGRVVTCANDDARTDFEDRTYRDYLDFRPFLDRYFKDEAEAVRNGYFFAKH